MNLRFEPRELPSVDRLDAVARAQIVAAGRRYDSELLTAEDRIGPDSGRAWYQPSRWAVIDADGHDVFDLWLYGVDSGTMFRAGTDEVIADLIQFGFTCPDDRETWRALATAALVGQAQWPESALVRYGFALDEDDTT